jgi:ABC-type transport system involved in multi-copper enzyme maturation permease subunit
MRELLAGELMKSRTRWLPYVLLVVMLLGAGLQIWVFGYTAWWYVHDSTDPVDQADLVFIIDTFTLPQALPGIVDAGQFWGSVIIGLFIASAVATEYNWGTVRQAIARGQSRNQWLTFKLLGLALFCAILLLIVLAWAVFSMLFTSALAGLDITLDPPGSESVSPFETVLIVLRAAAGIVPYALVAFALAVIGRSTALGAAGIILFVIIESTVIPIFGALPDPWPAFRYGTIGHHAAALLAANRIDGVEYTTLALRETPDPSDLPNAWVSLLALAAWCAGLLAATYYVFARRDLRLGTGE